MAEPFLSEIRIMSFSYAPKGWAMCNGQLLPINQNQALFSLLGTTFGGDGRVTFKLPDLRARVPTHVGSGLTLGEGGGESAHTLTQGEMRLHIHTLNCTNNDGTTDVAAGNVYATAGGDAYGGFQAPQAMSPQAVGNAGGGQAHNNQQPFLALTFCIALQGIFPSPN